MDSVSPQQPFHDPDTHLQGADGSANITPPPHLGFGPPAHKRTYQACIPCRRRKVRCDLGPVDNPTDPPCARCRREGKDCHFSATRRKRAADEELELGQDDYTARNARKRVMVADGDDSTTPAGTFQRQGSSAYADLSPSIGVHSRYGSTADVRSLSSRTTESRTGPTNSQRASADGHVAEAVANSTDGGAIFGPALPHQEAQHVTNQTAAAFLSKEINNPGDALHLLFEAAGRTGDLNHHGIGIQDNRPGSPDPTKGAPLNTADAGGAKPGVAFIDPALTAHPIQGSHHSTRADCDVQDAVQAWSRLRFVRAGWFTAQEAMQYIDYFYTYLSPLTPITSPDFRSPSTHATLLSDEPVLAITMLTTASRYMRLDGLGGVSRAFTIHEMLWTYLRRMIERLVWGQEQFGGGFGGAGVEKVDVGGQYPNSPFPGTSRRGELRTLGTVESLLLLTEWHPRALHFPPGDDENELLVPTQASEGSNRAADVSGPIAIGQPGANDGRPALSDWLEPAWRSDRMCWMLLFNALALAFELGVFDGMDRTSPYGSEADEDDHDDPLHRLRVNRVRRLLFVYVTQTSGRLGWPSPLPRYIIDSALFKSPGHVDHARKRRSRGSGKSEDTDSGYRISAQDILRDEVQLCWMGVTTLMKRSNELLFPSRNQTRETIRSGRYLGLLETFQPLLKGWRADFDKLEMPIHMRHILLIEYEYSRLYINSLALQAVVERWTSTAGNSAQRNRALSIRGGPGNGIVSMATLLELYRGNEEYIGEVVDASRNILRTVVDGLLPGDFLKHSPVRTYFRVLSGAMFLLKTFALGAKEDDVALSLSLMDRTIVALRTCVVDDVHLSIRIADLLDTLTSSIRTKFVRLAANNPPPNNYHVLSRSRSPMATAAGNNSPQDHHAGDRSGPSGTTAYLNNAIHPYTYAAGSTGRPPPAEALVGIATESIDPSDSSVIFMPPPDFSSSNFYGTYDAGSAATGDTNNPFHTGNDATGNNHDDGGPSGAGVGTATGGYMPDWLALPLDPLLNSGGGAGSGGGGGGGEGSGGQGGTATGGSGWGLGMGLGFGPPDVGNFDMLDILLGDYSFEGSGSGGASSVFR